MEKDERRTIDPMIELPSYKKNENELILILKLRGKTAVSLSVIFSDNNIVLLVKFT